MKKLNFRSLTIVSLFLVIGLTIFSFAAPVVKVIAPAKDKKDTIHLKIMKEVNGKMTEFDTIIYTDGNFDVDALLKDKDMSLTKDIDITINMDSIMTVVHQSLVNLPDMDSMMTVVCKSIRGLPNMDSIETVIHLGMKEMPDMDSIMTMVETGMKECPKTIRIIKTDSIGNNCCVYIDDKDIKNNHNCKKIIKDENKTIIIKCDKGDGNVTVKEINGKNCKNAHTIVCKVIIEDTGEKDKSIIKESNNTKETLKVDKLNFFPNPNTGKFNLSFSAESNGKTEVSILDANGKEVYKEIIPEFKGNYSKEIDISENPKGAYFLIVKQGKKAMTKKLIVQ